MGRYFPLFCNFEEKKILVIGAGVIGTRRIKTLLSFCPNITVIATDFSQEELPVQRICRGYEEGDVVGFDMVIAATNDREVNHCIYLSCKSHGILVNVIDCKEECDFYFPAIIVEDEQVIGVCGNGKDHSKVKQIAENIRKFLRGY